jgi:hypothetical protein
MQSENPNQSWTDSCVTYDCEWRRQMRMDTRLVRNGELLEVDLTAILAAAVVAGLEAARRRIEAGGVQVGPLIVESDFELAALVLDLIGELFAHGHFPKLRALKLVVLAAVLHFGNDGPVALGDDLAHGASHVGAGVGKDLADCNIVGQHHDLDDGAEPVRARIGVPAIGADFLELGAAVFGVGSGDAACVLGEARHHENLISAVCIERWVLEALHQTRGHYAFWAARAAGWNLQRPGIEVDIRSGGPHPLIVIRL